MTADERIRLFVALELPERSRRALVDWRHAALPQHAGLRAVETDSLHVTLCFLGWRAAGELATIDAACESVAGDRAAELALKSAVWLPRRRPRVLAVELEDPSRALEHVHTKLSDTLGKTGFYTPEQRRFLPHVTVARVSKGAKAPPGQLPDPPRLAFTATTVTLFRSRLGPGGARYEPLRSVELGAR